MKSFLSFQFKFQVWQSDWIYHRCEGYILRQTGNNWRDIWNLSRGVILQFDWTLFGNLQCRQGQIDGSCSLVQEKTCTVERLLRKHYNGLEDKDIWRRKTISVIVSDVYKILIQKNQFHVLLKCNPHAVGLQMNIQRWMVANYLSRRSLQIDRKYWHLNLYALPSFW